MADQKEQAPINAPVVTQARGEAGTVELPAEIFAEPLRRALLADVVRMQTAGRRSGTASTIWRRMPSPPAATSTLPRHMPSKVPSPGPSFTSIAPNGTMAAPDGSTRWIVLRERGLETGDARTPTTSNQSEPAAINHRLIGMPIVNLRGDVRAGRQAIRRG